MARLRVAVLVCLIGCGDDGGHMQGIDAPGLDAPGPDAPRGMAHGTAKMLNGASPGAAQSATALVAPAAGDGNWELSPTKIVAPLVGIELQGDMGPVEIPLTDCAVTFDLLQPGLAQTVSCPFDLPAGMYSGGGPKYGTTFDVLIDDSANGIYTDPASSTKLSATAPSGGAQAITLPNPRATMGTQVTKFATPFVVNAGDTVTVSVLLNALQHFQVNVNAGVISLGADANGMPGFADSVLSLGTPAAVAFYANPALGSAYSYNESALGSSQPVAISVMYSNAMTPAFLGISNGNLTGCGPFNQGFVFPSKGNGYLGLDTTGTLGWAGINNGTYAASMRMVQKSTIGQTTTFECLTTNVDPMPAGDSFSSGAPSFSTPTHTDSMTLVAN